MATLPIALQLYTVRDQTKQDFAGTIKQVAKLGYQGVELAGYGNLTSAAEVRKALDDAGLRVCGAHVGIEALESDVNKAMDESDTLGNKTIVVPYLAEPRRKDAAAWKAFAALLEKVAAQVKPRGFELAYHNHSFEFQTFDGQTGMDILWGNTHPANVKSELDVYWVKHGGQDPVGYINQIANRVALVHLKDMAPGADRKFAPVGTGTIDFKAVVDAAKRAGARWGIVEQDNCYDTPPLEAVRISMENVRKLGLA